jgi:Glycosyl transferase family 2
MDSEWTQTNAANCPFAAVELVRLQRTCPADGSKGSVGLGPISFRCPRGLSIVWPRNSDVRSSISRQVPSILLVHVFGAMVSAAKKSRQWCLVVATVNRTAELERFLAHIDHNEDVRILIVDQNLDDRLLPVLAKFDHLEIEHIKTEPKGLSNARNIGLGYLQEEQFVAFPDDDCCYERSTLGDVTAAFIDSPNVDAIITEWCGLDEHHSSPALSSQSLAAVSRYGALQRSPSYTLFFRRSAIEAAGEFDESLGVGTSTPWISGEDSDFLLRAGALVGRAARAPSIWVRHPLSTERWPIGRAYGYGRGRTQTLRKHRFPLWFQIAMVMHPLIGVVSPGTDHRAAKWNFFRGRLREFLRPYRTERRS